MSQNFTDNLVSTQLTTGVTTAPAAGTVETWAVASPAGFPDPPFEFGIDLTTTPELCLCTAISGVTSTTSNWTVERGYDNFTPVVHNTITAGQIVFITSAITPREGNAHITENYTASTLSTPDPVHPQYFDAANVRHGSMVLPDGSQTHTVGGPKNLPNFAIATNNIKAIPASHFGDVAYAGSSLNPANSLHIHGRESIEELEGGLWPPGTLALYAANGTPPGWMTCQGQDIRTDLAPQLYSQYGYAFGSAIDWYPATPIFPTYVGYKQQTIVDPYNQAELTVSAPYTYMLDPRNVVMYLPQGSHTYMKLPNIAQLPQVPRGVKWIVKVDYGYNWSPRPSAPPAQTLHTAPYSVDTYYPQAVAQDNPAAPDSPVIQVKTPAPVQDRAAPTGFKWAFDAVMGIPVVTGSGYIGPEQQITGPFLVPVLPYGSPIPNGMTLLPSTTPAPVSTTTAILSERNVQLKSIKMTVNNGFGYFQTNDNWLNLAGAPFLNASDPPVDGYYITGEVNAQQRNNQILIVASNVAINSWSPNGTVGAAQPMTSDILMVFYPVYT